MNNSAFRPGVLCYIKSDSQSNPGKIVQIIRKPFDGETFKSIQGICVFLNLSSTHAVWVVSGASLLDWDKGDKLKFKEVPIAQKLLVPISNGGLDEVAQELRTSVTPVSTLM